MKNSQRHYHVVLTTQSPVYIGDGQSVNKKEYIRNDNTLLIPNLHRMYYGLAKKGLAGAYEQFIMNPGGDLSEWLKLKRITSKDYLPWIDYTIDCGDVSLKRGTTVELMSFVKDAYGCPYVPGSSIKGMLRTILMSEKLISNKERFRRDAIELEQEARDSRDKRKYFLAKQASSLEKKVFYTLDRGEKVKPTDAVRDHMSGMHVSDSKPLSSKDLVACQKIDVSVDGKLGALNITRECLKVGTKIEFDMTLTEEFPYSAEDIMRAIEAFATRYHGRYYQHFRKNTALPAIKKNFVWIGGGVGYVSKTIVHPLLDKETSLKTIATIMRKTVNNASHRHEKDIALGVSPHVLKCTRYNGKLYEFGQCSFSIIEL